jgi:hypothetical protein
MHDPFFEISLVLVRFDTVASQTLHEIARWNKRRYL